MGAHVSIHADHSFASTTLQAIEFIIFRPIRKVMNPFPSLKDSRDISKENIVIISIEQSVQIVLDGEGIQDQPPLDTLQLIVLSDRSVCVQSDWLVVLLKKR